MHLTLLCFNFYTSVSIKTNNTGIHYSTNRIFCVYFNLYKLTHLLSFSCRKCGSFMLKPKTVYKTYQPLNSDYVSCCRCGVSQVHTRGDEACSKLFSQLFRLYANIYILKHKAIIYITKSTPLCIENLNSMANISQSFLKYDGLSVDKFPDFLRVQTFITRPKYPPLSPVMSQNFLVSKLTIFSTRTPKS